ncbi:glycine cleavage system aminomethyltransferase GcvT [Crassaminicella profunda]|uniref:glycine cleavage system aminomethyltransferase GcvT n=1 Tax=Crassaminicella profunda TaxID=1286698 RepID=UPI001CA633B5|nr:glycine cleavage system aminomethyltransferase GcvT [Crassaminicella profunda]QZY53605.1 glycine cleavage system aminomethyltransferase GcvT [Crassaminicella profunda]
MNEIRKTSLFEKHESHGGKIIDFSGWALPVQYEGITIEHESVRNFAGLFDVSHMGEVDIIGSEAFDFVQNLVTNDVSVLEEGQILYTFMCYPHGGVVDDLLVYKFNKDHFYLVINASNVEKDFKWMEDNIGEFHVKINNISDDVSEMAIQGPNAQKILQKLTDTNLSEIKFFYCKRNVAVAGANCLVSRTGYTGEDGFEIYLSHEDAKKVWDALLAAGKEEGLKPAGLGARDTLRFEASLPLYGNELSEEITPLEAGLGFFVKLNKSNFIGKEALVKQKAEGLKRKIVGFEMIDKGIPRHGYDVLAEGKKIGFVTTGYAAPTVKKNIGLAMVDIEYAKLDTPIEIQVRKRIAKAKVISKKFYNKNYKK